MELSIGQKVSYPNQGICLVEQIEKKIIGENSIKFYLLRVLRDNSTIFVPTENTGSVGIRPILSKRECEKLLKYIAADFTEVSSDWKTRSREFSEKLQSGNVFEVADVLKKIIFLSHEKKLSFREQTFMEKAMFLIVSEVINSGLADDEKILEIKIEKLVKKACAKHSIIQPSVAAPTGH